MQVGFPPELSEVGFTSEKWDRENNELQSLQAQWVHSSNKFLSISIRPGINGVTDFILHVLHCGVFHLMGCNISWCGIQDLQNIDEFLLSKGEHVFPREEQIDVKRHICSTIPYYTMLVLFFSMSSIKEAGSDDIIRWQSLVM